MRHPPILVVDAVWKFEADMKFHLYINPLLTRFSSEGEVDLVPTFTDTDNTSACGEFVYQGEENFEFYSPSGTGSNPRKQVEVNIHNLGMMGCGLYKLVARVRSHVKWDWSGDNYVVRVEDDEAVTELDWHLLQLLKKVTPGL